MIGDLGNNFDQNIGMMGRQFEDFGDTLGDQFQTVGSQMEHHFGNVGSQVEEQFEDVGNKFGQHMSSVGSNLGEHISSVGSNIDQLGSQIENSFNHQFGNFENSMDVFGTNLLGHFDNQLGNTPFGGNIDVFGMFGRSRVPWWKKENVCVERKVLEEEDDQPKNINIVSSGNSNFHMQVNQCVEGEDYYECSNTVADDGTVKTMKATYSCCHGFKKVGRGECPQLDIKSLDETIEDLVGKEYLNLVVENGLESMLSNVTIFVPNDEAVEDFRRDMDELSSFTQAENVVYSIDDGLIYRRKKRSIMIVEQPELPDIVAGHIVKGFVNTKDFSNDELVASENTDTDQIRMTIYPTHPEKTIMANCAKVTSKDNHAVNGIVHIVNKVILPAKNTIYDILGTDLQFKTFMSALETNDLGEVLAKEGHFTVFASTDEAFEKLDELTREKVLGNRGCAKDIIESHIISSVICSGIVENKVKISNMLGKDMLMTRDEDGNILVEGIKLMMKDKMATNGVIHVIEDVIIQKSVMSIIDHLKKKNSHKLLDLLEKTGLTKTVENLSNLTFFAPSEKAISEIPKELMDELVKDGKRLEEIVLHHIATEKKGSCHLFNNQHLDTVGGQKLRINLHKHFGHRHALGTQTHHAELYLFLIKALDLRSDGSFEMTPEVEDSVINSFLGLVLKLKPSEMQALFKRFIEWVGIENTSTYHPRSLTFFRFMQAAMTKFQKLFSPFFSMSFQLLISFLKEMYEVNEEEEECLEEPPRKRRKLNSESQREFMQKRQTAILRSSEIFFTLEEENTYMNKGAFNLVLEPLCQQLVLARILQPEQEYLRWAQTIFIPTIVAFAETTAEDVLLMALNGCLVKHSRSSSVEVRLASVEAITNIFQVVRIRYLSCLPETLVALDELLQDSDDRMEYRTKALIEIIEELTGESIEDHMN